MKSNEVTPMGRKPLFGNDRRKIARTVVTMRDVLKMSWQRIGVSLDISMGTARTLYDEVKGEGAHAGLLPGKGGRKSAKLAS